MLNHLDKHFVLYAKNHYKKLNQKQPLYDLAGIIEKACGLPQGYSSPYKAYLALSETFLKCTEEHHKKDFFKYLFSPLGTLTVQDSDYHYASQQMLNQLAIVQVYDNDKDKVLLDIGEADSSIWPLKED